MDTQASDGAGLMDTQDGFMDTSVSDGARLIGTMERFMERSSFGHAGILHPTNGVCIRRPSGSHPGKDTWIPEEPWAPVSLVLRTPRYTLLYGPATKLVVVLTP